MNDSPTFDQLALELLLNIAISTAVALAFVLWVHPLAYLVLGVIVALVFLGRRLTRPDTPRWVALAVVPIDAILWPTAVIDDVLRTQAAAETSEDDAPPKSTTANLEETPDKDGPGQESDQAK
jgi:type VI protein secretion system component VasK